MKCPVHEVYKETCTRCFEAKMEEESMKASEKVKIGLSGEPKTQCKCGAWKPEKFELCWNCWSKQKNIKK